MQSYIMKSNVADGKCSLQGAPGRMGQQGEPGIAGYEVITRVLSRIKHIFALLTSVYHLICLTTRATRDHRAPWVVQDQKVKRYKHLCPSHTENPSV